MHERLGCSTISFRHRPLAEALEIIQRLGFGEIDLGALPGVCNHLEVPLIPQHAQEVEELVKNSGLRVRTINLDLGPLNDPNRGNDEFAQLFEPFVQFALRINAQTIMLPCGGQNPTPYTTIEGDIELIANRIKHLASLTPSSIELLFEAPHVRRLCNSVAKADALIAIIPEPVANLVLDTSHVFSTGGDVSNWGVNNLSRIRHIQFRDALRDGEINLSIGNGQIDFKDAIHTFESKGYRGTYSLELETHDLEELDRELEVARAGKFVTELIGN